MIFNINIFFPINACRQDVAMRWDSLDTGVAFTALEGHVQLQNPLPGNCNTYLPSFAVPVGASPCWDRYANAAKRDQIAALETATAYCVAAKAMVPKSMTFLLASAHTKCRLFDTLIASEAQAAQKRREDRVKGGKARQEKLRPAREYALRLASSMHPDEGWKNAGEAARAIYPHVKDFVIRNRLALVPGDSLIRTIRNWLREDRAKVF